MATIEVKNLTHSYAEGTPYCTHAIKNVSFSADRGEIIGIIGHTGSGKSTLMQHLNGLLKPDSGEVFVDGENIWNDPKNIRKIRFKVGMVFQYPEHQLFDETVYKDISFGPRNMGLTPEEIDTSVRYAQKLVGLDESFSQRSPFELSGGEMRRVAIAGVIAMKPKILVLDEPTAGLDPKGRDIIMSRIIEYRNSTDATVIISSHSMEDIAAVCDKVLVMSKGEVFMYDKTENVFTDEKRLLEIGLNVPQITKIMLKVRNNGVNINPKCFTVDDAFNAIKAYIGGERYD